MVKKQTRVTKTRIKAGHASPEASIDSHQHRDQERSINSTSDLMHSDTEPEVPTNLLTGFWEKFRLSPIEREHTMLTNIGWLTLITLGPLALLDVLDTISYIIYYKGGDVFQYLLSNFGDRLFRIAALSLFFGAVIFRYRWYPSIRRAFESLLPNDVLRDRQGGKLTESEFLGFLEEYHRNLHRRKRYIPVVVSILCTWGLSLFITMSRGYYWDMRHLNNPLELLFFLRQIVRWFLATGIWSYIGMLWLWELSITTRTVEDLTPRFQIKVQPLHSDRAGGLKRLGDLCAYVGLMVIVVVTLSSIAAIQGTIFSARIAPCGSDLQQFVSSQVTMSEDRLTECIYYAASRYQLISRADVTKYVTQQLANGITLKELATSFYNSNPDYFKSEMILSNYYTYYIFDIVLFIIVIFAFSVLSKPLRNIHNRMNELEQIRESETNKRISLLFDEMTILIKQDKLEEANKIKSNINFLTNELTEIQKYPRWPIRLLPVARSYLTFSTIAAVITFVIPLIQLSLSPELYGAFDQIRKSVSGP